MNKTKIEWLNGGYTWNPVTGCLHNCEYCYARKIANRFKTESGEFFVKSGIDEWQKWRKGDGIYTRYFNPQFHKDRLNEPQKHKKPQNVFVCSMADLFGDWVPDEWIKAVFEACEKAPQHRYLFLTKNPKRYESILEYVNYNNMWLGTTITTQEDLEQFSFNFLRYTERKDKPKTFYSIEPLQGNIFIGGYLPNWVIVGAETGNRKEKVIPEREWIENIVSVCRYYRIPLFMKNSLAGIWGKKLIQEYPWEV